MVTSASLPQAQVIRFPRRRRPQRSQQAPRRANQWDRGKLSRITFERCGTHFISDTDAGRAMLVALLHCGLDQRDALTRAPWLEPGELRALRRAASATPFDDLGPLIKLTWDELVRWEAWRFYPCDISREEYERRKRERRKAKDAERKRDERAWNQRRPVGDLRMESVMHMLADGPATVPQLFKRALRSRPFQPGRVVIPGMPERNWSRAEVVRNAVHRIVQRLAKLGMVETKVGKKGRRGPVLWVRLAVVERRHATRKADAKCYAGSVAPPATLTKRGKRRNGNGLGPVSDTPTHVRFTLGSGRVTTLYPPTERAPPAAPLAPSNRSLRHMRKQRVDSEKRMAAFYKERAEQYRAQPPRTVPVEAKGVAVKTRAPSEQRTTPERSLPRQSSNVVHLTAVGIVLGERRH